jgi:uncharacterized membrane protein
VQQIKSFHWWLSLAQLLVAAIVGSQGLLSPKAMQVFIVVNGFLGAAVHQLAAKWQPAKSTEEEPK